MSFAIGDQTILIEGVAKKFERRKFRNDWVSND